MKKNKSRYAVMGLLSMGPMSGYDIKKKFEKIASNFWNESYGQIYPILKRLKLEGMATRTTQRQTGKPDRHIYQLTPEGHEELKDWLLEPVQQHVGRHEILLKLFFGSMNTVAENMQQVKHFKAIHENELQELKSIRTRMKADSQGNPQLPYWLMTVRYGELVNEALLKWTREVLSQMTKMVDPDEQKNGG